MIKTLSLEVRVLASLAQHERLLQQVGQMKTQIAEHLNECPVMKKANDWDTPEDARYELQDQKGRIKTHLWEAFNTTVESDWGNPILMDYDDQEIHLSEEDTGCEHCYAAWRVIQERKEVRQQLGRARLSLRQLGKSAIKAMP